jgi:hypothetical protein
MLEAICVSHLLIAVVFVGIILVISLIIKPAPLIVPMLPADESKYDLMQVDSKGNITVVQLKEPVHGKCNEQEALACHQESPCV